MVFELADSGDPVSTQIVDAAGSALAELAVAVAGRLDLSGPVVLAGGLAVHQPALQQIVRADWPSARSPTSGSWSSTRCTAPSTWRSDFSTPNNRVKPKEIQ